MTGQNKIDEKLLAYLLDELDDVGREEVELWLEESERNIFGNFNGFIWNFNGECMPGK